MGDLKSSIEVQAVGRTWLMIHLNGRTIGQLAVNDDELPDLLKAIPLDGEQARLAGPQSMGGRKTARSEPECGCSGKGACYQHR